MRKAMRYSPLASPARRVAERATDGGHRIPHRPAPKSLWAEGPSLDYNAVLRIVSPYIQRLFIPLRVDAETTDFLNKYCRGEPFWRYLMTSAFRHCFSLTDTNAILGRGQMFVASTEQFRYILRASGSPEGSHLTLSRSQDALPALVGGSSGRALPEPEPERGPEPEPEQEQEPLFEGPEFHNLLDIGAGDGTVTSKLVPLLAGLPDAAPSQSRGGFSVGTVSEYLGLSTAHKAERRDLQHRVVATEASRSMCSRLTNRGFTSIQTCDLADVIRRYPDGFDLIACLNVLDRADKPSTLLRDIRRLLRGPDSRLVLAVVLPFCPFVEDGTRQRRPSERLDMKGGRCREGASFEAAVEALIRRVLEPAGYTVHSWSMVPYISAGDIKQPYYRLHDALLVLSKQASEGATPLERGEVDYDGVE